MSDKCPKCNSDKIKWISSDSKGDDNLCKNCGHSFFTYDPDVDSVWNSECDHEWIKCSERMPPFEKKVLVIDKDGWYDIAEYQNYECMGSPNVFTNQGEGLNMTDVIAWMELPELPE